MLPISTLPGPKDEEHTYPSLPKYYFLIKTGLENGPKYGQKNGPKNSPIVKGSIGPVYILPYARFSGVTALFSHPFWVSSFSVGSEKENGRSNLSAKSYSCQLRYHICVK